MDSQGRAVLHLCEWYIILGAYKLLNDNRPQEFQFIGYYVILQVVDVLAAAQNWVLVLTAYDGLHWRRQDHLWYCEMVTWMASAWNNAWKLPETSCHNDQVCNVLQCGHNVVMFVVQPRSSTVQYSTWQVRYRRWCLMYFLLFEYFLK